MLNAQEIFVLATLYLVQEDPGCEDLLNQVLYTGYFDEDLEKLTEKGFIAGSELLPAGYNSIHTDPRSLNSKQLGFRLVATLETLYNRKDFNALKYIPVKIKEQMISSLAASLNNYPSTDVVAEFQRTTPKEEVVIEQVQEVEVVAKSKPKKSRKKA